VDFGRTEAAAHPRGNAECQECKTGVATKPPGPNSTLTLIDHAVIYAWLGQLLCRALTYSVLQCCPEQCHSSGPRATGAPSTQQHIRSPVLLQSLQTPQPAALCPPKSRTISRLRHRRFARLLGECVSPDYSGVPVPRGCVARLD
jgi:hypothetical protein